MTSIDPVFARVGDDGSIPKERYVSPAFLDLELGRVWSRVWQVACREEQLAAPGDFVEYRIGDESILVVRTAGGEVTAFHNTCLHRGRCLAEGAGCLGRSIRCPYHGWEYRLDGALEHVPDAHEFPGLASGMRLAPVRCDTWAGFVFVNLDPAAAPLLDFLGPLPALLAPYHLDRMRLRAHLTTTLHANWKVVVDAFNEGYHVQGLHPQILPWTDDVAIEYEQFDVHAHYGRLPGARRVLRPSPRIERDAGDVDEGEILAALVAGLGGAFLAEERTLVEEVRSAPLPPGRTLLEEYQHRRMALMRERGIDVSGLAPEQMTSADDVYLFPNVVGPIYPGSAILFRVRPDGRDPDRAVKDTWVLEWPRRDREWTMPDHRVYGSWRERDWGEITNQDYENVEAVQRGMKSSACSVLRLNERQESNILHMHRVLDRYLDAG